MAYEIKLTEGLEMMNDVGKAKEEQALRSLIKCQNSANRVSSRIKIALAINQIEGLSSH